MKRMIIVLTLATLFSGLVLAATFVSLSPLIELNRERALQASLAALFADVEDPTFEQLDVDVIDIYRGVDSEDQLIGYAVRITAAGYNGPINMLIGLTPELTQIEGLQVVENLETPGLGGRITENQFRGQFRGLNPTRAIRTVRNVEPDPEANEVQAISGATISTNAVVEAINRRAQEAIDAIRAAEGR
ncbi:MAG: FMN-binding protein [Spirochaetaceae bacterium]|nr:MAG: FMN-binding protein [Spirochaetaceae bacterium]